MGFDMKKAAEIASVEDEGIIVHLHDEQGDELFYDDGGTKRPVTITVAGSYSTVYRKAKNAQANRYVRMKRAKLSGELVDEGQIELEAACVLAWAGIEADGKAVPCTKENAKALLSTVPYVREQVQEAMNDHEGFSKSASRS